MSPSGLQKKASDDYRAFFSLKQQIQSPLNLSLRITYTSIENKPLSISYLNKTFDKASTLSVNKSGLKFLDCRSFTSATKAFFFFSVTTYDIKPHPGLH